MGGSGNQAEDERRGKAWNLRHSLAETRTRCALTSLKLTLNILLNRMNTPRVCGYCESGWICLKMYVFQNLEHSWSWSGDLPFSSLSNLGGAIETCEYQIGSQLNCGRASRWNRRNRFSEDEVQLQRDLGRAGFMESPCVERGRDCPRQYRLVRGGFNTQCPSFDSHHNNMNPPTAIDQ